jgi:hypothetical protein
MAAMQKLTLNSNNWQSAIQNIQEIWREEEEKAAVLLESWLQCLSYWNSFIRIICLRLVFVGRHSSVDKAPANPAARLAPWIGRTPNTKFQHLLWVVSWFPYLRKKAVFLMPAWDPRETSLLVSARGGGDSRISNLMGERPAACIRHWLVNTATDKVYRSRLCKYDIVLSDIHSHY